MITIGFLTLFGLVVYLFVVFLIEKRRNRVLQAFMAGIIKSVSDYVSTADVLDMATASDINMCKKEFPIPYDEILQNVSKEFKKDFWMQTYRKRIMKDRNLFYEKRYLNNGFNMIYWDFFDKAIAEIQKETKKEGRFKKMVHRSS